MSLTDTPQALGYRWPAEWEPHAATWIAWPHNVDTWPGRFAQVPLRFAELIRALAQYEPVRVLSRWKSRNEAGGRHGWRSAQRHTL